MPGAGFIGAVAPDNRRRRRNGAAQPIAATILPASSVLVVGQSLSDTTNWPLFLDPANYATSAPGESIAGVTVNYIGSTGTASESLADGDTNVFSITVTDTAGNARTFSTVPRTVLHSAPVASGGLADQSLTAASGAASLDAAVAFSGADLRFTLSGPAGVSIDAATGLVSFDTDALALQSGTPVTVTASNSGGSATAGFALTVLAPVVYAAGITGLVNNPTHGPSARIGTALNGEISNLLGSETVLHRWRLDGGLIGGAGSASYTPAPGDDLGLLSYAPLVNGEEVASPSYTVRFAPPVAGSLAPVDTVEGGGGILVNLVPGFTGDNITYTETAGWASISGSTLTIDDAPRSDTLTITATNSGGQATVDLDVTIAPLLVTLVTAIANQTLQQGSGDVTIDLTGIFANATGYAVSGAGASIDGDGITLRLDDGTIRTGEIITVTANNANGSLQEQFTLDVVAVLETDFVMTIETTVPNEAFTLPLTPGTSTGTVNMGDGKGDQAFSVHNDPVFSTTYPTPGTHTIRLSGNINSIRFSGAPASDRNAVRTIENMGEVFWNDMALSFASCAGLTSVTFGNCHTRNVQNWWSAFAGCPALTTVNLTGIQTDNATVLQAMFADCASLATVTGIENIDTSTVQRMDEMFHFCPSLDAAQLDISGWNFSSLLPPNGGEQRGLFNFIDDTAALSQSVYDALLLSMDGQPIAPGCFFGFGDSPYTTGGAAEAARAGLIGTRGLAIEDAGNAAPEQMGAPALVVDSDTQITATLAQDPFTNGLPIMNFDLRLSTDLVNWTTRSNVSSPVVLTGLTAGTQYYVQTRANNFDGDGAWSGSATATTSGGVQPLVATRSGTDLVLTDVPDISPQGFAAAPDGADLVITFTAPIETPAPTQAVVIDAANHNGTAPDTGSYDLQVFDLGVGVNSVYTLSGVNVPAGAMVALLDPRADVVGGGLEEFERVVFIGASIMEQTFGSSLSLRNTAAEAAFAAQGAVVEVYAHAAGGSDAGQVQTLLSEALATFPDKTLFFVHAGGNNVTANRPYPGGDTTLTGQLDGLIDIAATRPGSVIISDLTFRDYGGSTATNEAAGAKPYNDTIYLPAFRARAGDLLSRAYYADGTPVSCLYEWSWENRAAYLSGDNIHPENPGGRNLLRSWLAERLAPICLGLPAPAQFVRTAPPPAPALDIFVEYGVQTASGVNTPAFTFLAGSGQTSDGPFALLNADGTDPGVSLTLNFSAPAPGDSSGFGINTAGNGDGAPGFDGTLMSSVFTADSYFAGAAYTVDHVISGLAANTAYRVELVASRDAGDSRETRYDFANGETATIQTTADPTQAPVAIDTVSDGAGQITLTQSAVSGAWSYLGGLRITTI